MFTGTRDVERYKGERYFFFFRMAFSARNDRDLSRVHENNLFELSVSSPRVSGQMLSVNEKISQLVHRVRPSRR